MNPMGQWPGSYSLIMEWLLLIYKGGFYRLEKKKTAIERLLGHETQ